MAIPQSGSLLRFACRLSGDRAAAEDLVQETLLQAWRSFHQFEPGSNMRAWLFRILVNTFYGQGRRIRLAPVMVPISSGMHSSAFATDERLEVLEALEQLPSEQRAVLLLGVVEGFTCSEMSKILSLPIGTVMSRLSRARRALREKLSPLSVAL
ncbi:MAG: sigma-70 family RNA polymerase sigma factor [Bryobacteraceae bacterium]